MPTRTITTLTTGNVIVVDHSDGKTALGMREYTRRGQYICLMRDGLPAQPVCRGLSTHGRPLCIRRGEALEDAIRHTLAVHDGETGPAWAHWLSKRLGWLLIGVLLVAAAGAWIAGIADLAAPMGIVR